MTDIRYPVGPAPQTASLTLVERQRAIATINSCPDRMRDAVHGLTGAQLNTPYRDGGWTVRQVVHHVADSHLNAYTRFRLALTESCPTIRTYDETQWAELPDARDGHPGLSLALLDALHARWAVLLHGLTPEQCVRTFRHPDRGERTVDDLIAGYAWHTVHHATHITALRDRMHW